ncbi:hypothetical protein [Moritella sp. F3]|uniref:hypothetical protein n=1 Tax=Moritella sp. F3 TaxID=2718882 RepID=UPI0018E0D65F|nr:hypothetical protein [Moritella sp. F3]GIC77609.1 hypothetical protein FMO001_23360 [Moritella sp. F1]GIC82022.1 hypothetical protein FMO003_23030 [Moritella sp. F3]
MNNSNEVTRLINLYSDSAFKDKLEIAVSERFASFNQILIIDRTDVLVVPIAAGFSPDVYGKLINEKIKSAYAEFFLIENEVSRIINNEDAPHLLKLNPVKGSEELIKLNLEGKSVSFGDLGSSTSKHQWFLNFKRSGNSHMENLLARNI